MPRDSSRRSRPIACTCSPASPPKRWSWSIPNGSSVRTGQRTSASSSRISSSRRASPRGSACIVTIASGRRITFGDRYIRAGKWNTRGQGRYGRIGGLGGARLGILGLGAIGVEVARRAEAFGMEIGYHNRRKRDDVAYEDWYGHKLDRQMLELLQRS